MTDTNYKRHSGAPQQPPVRRPPPATRRARRQTPARPNWFGSRIARICQNSSVPTELRSIGRCWPASVGRPE